MKRMRMIAGALVLAALAGFLGFQASEAADGAGGVMPAGAVRRAYWRALGIKTAQLNIRVVDAITQQGIPGAGCIVGETGDRIETDEKGVAPTIDAPIFRNQRLETMLAELHGQLTVLCYKNGYRDAIYMGVRMHEGDVTEPAIWMFPIGAGDARVEPTLHQMPIHRLWRIRLADKYRLFEQGEGPESPELSRPTAQPAPQQPMGIGQQSPLRAPAPPMGQMAVPPEPPDTRSLVPTPSPAPAPAR